MAGGTLALPAAPGEVGSLPQVKQEVLWRKENLNPLIIFPSLIFSIAYMSTAVTVAYQ